MSKVTKKYDIEINLVVKMRMTFKNIYSILEIHSHNDFHREKVILFLVNPRDFFFNASCKSMINIVGSFTNNLSC